MGSVPLNLRVEPDLKQKLKRLAHREGKTTSLMVREALEAYVKERDIAGYIDDLWARTGGKLREKGFKPIDVDKAISDVRKRKAG